MKEKKLLPVPSKEPQTFYKWDPTDLFTFSGKDFSAIFNTLDQIVNNPAFHEKLMEAKQTIGIVSVHEIMKNKLSENIKLGIVKSVTKEEYINSQTPKKEEIKK